MDEINMLYAQIKELEEEAFDARIHCRKAEEETLNVQIKALKAKFTAAVRNGAAAIERGEVKITLSADKK